MPKDLQKNLLASFVLFLIAIPLNLGIALASGVMPTAGLVSGMVGGIVVGLLAGSPLQISGPATGLIAVVWQIIDTHGIAMLGPIVVMAGLLQIALGKSNLAPWFRAVAPAVIQGMLAGIGILIFASQLQVVLQRTPKTSGLANLMSVPGALMDMLVAGTARGSAGIAAVTVLTIVLWRFWHPKRLRMLPGSLVGVMAGVLAAAVFKPNVPYVNLPSNPLSEVSPIALSSLAHTFDIRVMESVFALAFIATVQTLLTATAVDRLHNFERVNYNKEIIAQGIANSCCGLLNVMPVCGVIVRSSANIQAGATNRSSNIMHGIWVGLFTLFLSPWLEHVPLAALAAVLVYTGYKLVDLNAVAELRKFGNVEFAIYLVTAGCVVLIDLLSGIIIGFLLSAARLIYVLTHCESEIREDAGSGSVVMELKGSATFFTLPRLADALNSIPARREVHLFMSGLNHIDHACLEHLMGWEELYINQGGQVFIEWDHLIGRFHKPLTKEIGAEIEATGTARKSHETYDVLAARAQIVDLERAASWKGLAEATALALDNLVPNYQRPAITESLREQLENGSALKVSDIIIPHLMLAGIPRHELVLVKIRQGLGHLDESLSSVHCLVALVGPPKTSEHLNVLARLSNRAEEGLSAEVQTQENRQTIRRLLLKHSRFITLIIEAEKPTGAFHGQAIWQLAKLLPPDVLVAQLYRGGEELVPGGSTVLRNGDKILVLGSESAVEKMMELYLEAPEA